jgi:hypothetical protein
MVALNRISVYLQEDEVSDQVSTLKKDVSLPRLSGYEEDGLGLKNATLRWNEVETVKEGKQTDSATTLPVFERSRSPSSPDQDRRFELKDISVVFPERELSLITGPTAR